MSKGIAILASGGGSNAEKIIEHFADNDTGEIRLIISNNSAAYVLERAAKHNIPTCIVSKAAFSNKENILALLEEHKIDFIVLAGFLLLIPPYLINTFPKRIVNIHPSLLPNYGGKGMFGSRVHQAVFNNNERESGITIHYVDPAYDEGEIIYQEKVQLESMDTPDIIAKKVLALEHKNYGVVIESILS